MSCSPLGYFPLRSVLINACSFASPCSENWQEQEATNKTTYTSTCNVFSWDLGIRRPVLDVKMSIHVFQALAVGVRRLFVNILHLTLNSYEPRLHPDGQTLNTGGH